MVEASQLKVRFKEDPDGPHDKIEDLRYDLEIAPDIEELKFHASCAFSFSVKDYPIKYLLMHIKNLNIHEIFIESALESF